MKKILQKSITLLLAIFISLSCVVGCTANQPANEHEHNFVCQVVEPTCSTAGYDLYKCDCEEEYIKSIVQALGHNFVNYLSDGNATFDNDGTKTAVCSREGCNATDTVVDVGTKLKKDYTVTLIFDNGEKDEQFTVKSGNTFSTPNDPYKQNYIFTGWVDSKTQKKYDFSQPVSSDVSLRAEYEIDAVKLTNAITTDSIKSVVKVYNKRYNKRFNTETDVSVSLGSGFCFNVQNETYYILTNCHVAYKESDFSYQEFTVEDYLGKTYTAHLYKNPNKSSSAIAASYDLACLYFTVSETNVKAISLANENLQVGDDAIAIGSPKGQTNAITFGVVKNYTTIELSSTPKEESNVEFDVMYSTALANNGSSGGPVLNSNLEVVAVVYAGNKSDCFSYSIPLLKVKEFLSEYVYS